MPSQKPGNADDGQADELLGSSALRERGWTPAMIRDLLGDADQTRPNPYSGKAPMRLWSLRRIQEAEASPGFAERQATAKRRSVASASAADRKREELLDQIYQVPVSVPLMDRDRLIYRACQHYNERAAWRDGEWTANPDADEGFLYRITVNYLRHELTDYEAELDSLRGLIGRAEASRLIRARILGAIAEAYPWLAGECRRQKAERPHPERAAVQAWA